jgi:hypothetical protein
MKKLSFLVIALVMSTGILAQSPEAFKYQAVARDASGNVLANTTVSFRISILRGSATGSVVYTELHTYTTNAFGLVDLEIGKGTNPKGTFSIISWANDTHYVKVEMDPAGGTAYQDMGVSQLLSVPYALHAGTAGKVATEGNIAIESKGGNVIVLAGTNKITIDPSGGVTIESNNIKLAATGNLILSGDSVQINGKQFGIKTTDFNLEASAGVKMSGPQIGINAIDLSLNGQAETNISATNLKLEGSAQTEMKGASVKVTGGGITEIVGGLVKIN